MCPPPWPHQLQPSQRPRLQQRPLRTAAMGLQPLPRAFTTVRRTTMATTTSCCWRPRPPRPQLRQLNGPQAEPLATAEAEMGTALILADEPLNEKVNPKKKDLLGVQ
jgi:hypothetical protein